MKFITAVCAACLFGVIGATMYSCQNARDQYYVAMNKCTDKNGTWVPKNDGSTYTGMCIYPH